MAYLVEAEDPQTGEIATMRRTLVLDRDALPNNVQRVGLALVAFGLVLIGLLRAKRPAAPA